jgi:hypothetical protein
MLGLDHMASRVGLACVAVPAAVSVEVKQPVSTRFRDQMVERETGVVVPGTKRHVEFTYRLG